MDISKQLLLQYDFRAAIPLVQVIHDYYNPSMTEAEISRKARNAEFPFPVYRADTKNKKSAWYVNLVSLAEWLNKKQQEAKQDFINMHSP